jgi:hypothetical protein
MGLTFFCMKYSLLQPLIYLFIGTAVRQRERVPSYQPHQDVLVPSSQPVKASRHQGPAVLFIYMFLLKAPLYIVI